MTLKAGILTHLSQAVCRRGELVQTFCNRLYTNTLQAHLRKSQTLPPPDGHKYLHEAALFRNFALDSTVRKQWFGAQRMGVRWHENPRAL